MNPEASWWYVNDGERVGPVTSGEMKRLAAAGRLGRSTMIWTPDYGAEWKAFEDSEFATALIEPPPLPCSVNLQKPRPHLDHRFAWLLAVMPLSGILFVFAASGNAVADLPPADALIVLSSAYLFTGVWLPLLLVSAPLIRYDAASGPTAEQQARLLAIRNLVILVPVYLFKRARILKSPAAYVAAATSALLLAACVAAFILHMRTVLAYL